jgi:hypothetical protein
MSRAVFLSGLIGVFLMHLADQSPNGQTEPQAKGKAPASATKSTAKPQPARQTVALRDKLNELITLAKGIDANTPLRDAVESLSQEYDLTIVVNAPAFQEEGVVGVEDQPVQLPKLVKVRLDTVLGKLASQVNGAVLLKPDHIEITTQKRLAEAIRGTDPQQPLESEAGRPRPQLPLVNVAFVNRPLDAALRDLTDRTGVSVVLDLPRAGERAKLPVTATLDNVPLDSAVRSLASQADLRPAIVDNVLFVTTAAHAQELLREEQVRSALDNGTPPETALAQQLQQPVSVNLDEVPLRTALRTLSRETGTQVLVDQRAGNEAEIEITLQLKEVSLETAVRLAAEMVGLKPVLVGNVLFVTTESVANKLQAEHERAIKNVTAGFNTLGAGGGLGLGGGLGGLGGGALGLQGGALGLQAGGLPGPGTPRLITITAQPAKTSSPRASADKKAPGKTPSVPAARTANRLGQLTHKLAEVVSLKNGFDAKTPLKDALDFLNDQFELSPILIDTAAFKAAGLDAPADQPVQLPRLTGVRLGSILSMLAAQVHGAYLVRPDHISLTTTDAWRLEIWGRSNEEGGVKHRRPLPLVHATFEQRPLDEALRELADATGFSVVLDTRQAGEHSRAAVTALLNNVPLDTAVRLLADQANLQAVLLDNVLQVTTKERARALKAEHDRANQNGIDFLPSFRAPGPGQ